MELASRNIYWRSSWLRNWVKKRKRRSLQTQHIVDRQELLQRLQEIGVCEGALAMAHTSITGLLMRTSTNPEKLSSSPLQTATLLVNDLLELVGSTGTLLMPTNPIYQNAKTAMSGEIASDIPLYDPARTPCCVGLVNEVFWRRQGVQRSLHPYNSLAVRGPLASELLCDNLNEFKPLPHGIYSGYYRFCQHNGLVFSIGVRLASVLTLVHAAEDALDTQYPLKDFYQDHRYIVRVNGIERPWTIRQVRSAYPMFCRCGRKLRRDLLGEGILHEGEISGVPIDWAHSKEVFDYITARCKKRPYPHYCTWLAGDNT